MYNSRLKVNIQAIMQNLSVILDELGAQTELIPVLKDDAYGLGLVPIAKALSQHPQIKTMAVSHISEGVKLRQEGISSEILVMGSVPTHLLGYAVEHTLTVAVGRLGLLPTLAELCRQQGKCATIQLKIETGLHRHGVSPGDELAALLEELHLCSDVIHVSGGFSHFSDFPQEPLSCQQYDLLNEAIAQATQAGISIPKGHISCSAATEYGKGYHMDAVRVGRRLYMDHPTAPVGNIQEVASWQTYITHLHLRKAGESIGYGGAYTFEKDTMVATIGVGYGDGLHQGLVAQHAPVLVGGVEGRLLACCMDQSFIDVTGIDCQIDQVVTMFGYDEWGNHLSSQALSLLVGGDEGCGLTSMLSPRVERIYLA